MLCFVNYPRLGSLICIAEMKHFEKQNCAGKFQSDLLPHISVCLLQHFLHSPFKVLHNKMYMKNTIICKILSDISITLYFDIFGIHPLLERTKSNTLA